MTSACFPPSWATTDADSKSMIAAGCRQRSRLPATASVPEGYDQAGCPHAGDLQLLALVTDACFK